MQEIDRSSEKYLQVNLHARNVRALRHVAMIFSENDFHATRLRHCDQACAAAIRPRHGCVRAGELSPRHGRRTDHRLISNSRRSVTPTSEARERPRTQTPGAFCFCRSQTESHSYRDVASHPEASGQCWFESGKTAEARKRCAWMLRHGRWAMRHRKRIGAWYRRQCETSIRRFSAAWTREFQPVRTALPWRMPKAARGCFARRWLRGRASVL